MSVALSEIKIAEITVVELSQIKFPRSSATINVFVPSNLVREVQKNLYAQLEAS